MDKDNARRAGEFLEFVAANSERLRHNLIKNINHDADRLEDAFGDTVVATHRLIADGELRVEDYERYFFTASRFNYINLENRERKERERHIEITGWLVSHDVAEEERTDPEPGMTVGDIREEVARKFGERVAAMFMDYFGCRVRGRYSYRKYATIEGYSISEVAKVIGEVKKYLRRKRHGLDQEEGEESDTEAREPEGSA